MSEAIIRAKFLVYGVKRVADSWGTISQEEIELNAVYGKEGSSNEQWSKYTPYGNIKITISNPSAFGKVLPGAFFFIDFIPTDKESL